MTAEQLLQAIRDLLFGGGAGLVVILSLIEITPAKVNPWRAIARALGRAINGEVLESVAEAKKAQKETRRALDEHIRADDERNADTLRMRILHFNNELLRGDRHTREDFIEILAVIDAYEQYCKNHPNYRNNRASHAIANIGRVYDDRLKLRDFLGENKED